MDKLYEINFSQTFEETRTVRASSQDDAIEKLKDVWGCGADVEVFNIEVSDKDNTGKDYDPEDKGDYV